jgi:hypothetical protein
MGERCYSTKCNGRAMRKPDAPLQANQAPHGQSIISQELYPSALSKLLRILRLRPGRSSRQNHLRGSPVSNGTIELVVQPPSLIDDARFHKRHAPLSSVSYLQPPLGAKSWISIIFVEMMDVLPSHRVAMRQRECPHHLLPTRSSIHSRRSTPIPPKQHWY